MLAYLLRKIKGGYSHYSGMCDGAVIIVNNDGMSTN